MHGIIVTYNDSLQNVPGRGWTYTMKQLDCLPLMRVLPITIEMVDRDNTCFMCLSVTIYTMYMCDPHILPMLKVSAIVGPF